MPRINEAVRPIIQAAKANDFKVVPDGRSKHYKIVYGKSHGAKAGQRVQDDNGPLIVSGTPSEIRDKMEMMNRLLAAGVITKKQVEQIKGQQSGREWGGDEPPPPTEKDVEKEREQAELRDRSARLTAETAELRGRLEPIVVGLGGWRARPSRGGVSVVELGELAWWYGKTRQWKELPEGADDLAAKTSAENLRTPGATVAPRWLPFWRRFIDSLEIDGDPAGRYLELRREMKGIAPPIAGEALPPPQQGSRWAMDSHEARGPRGARDEYERRWESHLNPGMEVAAGAMPAFTMRVVMMLGRSPENDPDEIMEIAQKIMAAELEGNL